MNDIAANQTGPEWLSGGAQEPADEQVEAPRLLTPAEGLARLLDLRRRQMANLKAGMASEEHPDEWRGLELGVGQLSLEMLAKTQLAIIAFREEHPELLPDGTDAHVDRAVRMAAAELANEEMGARIDALIEMASATMPGGFAVETYEVLRGQIWQLLARRS